MSTSEPDKYSELRATTDRQLVKVISGTLHRGLRAVQHQNAQPELRLSAETAYAEAITLLPLVHEVSGPERASLEAKIAELREWLETGDPRVRTAAA